MVGARRLAGPVVSSRDAILGRIRKSRGRGPLDAAPPRPAHPPLPARAQVEGEAAVAQFAERAEAVSATVIRIATLADLPDTVGAYLASQNLPSDLLVSDDPRFDAVPWDDRPTLEIRRGAPAKCDLVMMCFADAAIAETGSLVMAGDADNPYMASFVPETAIVVLPKSRVGGGLEAAFADFGAGKAMPRALTFVTGPSRTGDIALQIELGAHGPRRVHIVIADDDGDEEIPLP